jgi:heat-inducible transcriptional repressor
MDLSGRAFSVICGVVELYIRTGAPIASRQVARSSRSGISSATIRNVMAKLEEEGYLTRSHPSAGCIPTDRSFRLYVDSLAQHRRLSGNARRRLVQRMTACQRELEEDIEWVAEVAAEVTQEAGMAIRPMEEGPVLEAVSLVHLGGRRVLGVVVTTDGTVDKRVLTRSSAPTPQLLQRESNFLSQTYRGMSLERIRRRLDSSSAEGGDFSVSEDDPVVESAAEVARQLFDEVEGEVEIQVAGTDNLLQTSDFAEAERLRSLIAALQDRRRIVREWRRVFDRGRTQVIIGRESEVTASGNLGMVATLFYHKGRRAGALGVVGPRRMDYGRIVPVVEFIGDTLTQMLEEPGAAHG